MLLVFVFFCFKQKTAYAMRISNWSSDVCSSDLPGHAVRGAGIGRWGGEAHVGAAGRAIIEIDVDAVSARRHEVAALKAGQVGGVLASTGKHADRKSVV